MSEDQIKERIAELRKQAEKHRQTAIDSWRYEVYFREMLKAAKLEEKAEQLELETTNEALA